VVDAETLRDAQIHPEEHRDLIVRVAGYSDYFCDLSKTQDSAGRNHITNGTHVVLTKTLEV